jgi:N-acetylneuraminate synthase/N,N'-diacetyllegionaminate synthase
LDLAIESKADVVKFQIYYPDTLVNKIESPNRYNHFKQFTFTPEQHIELAKKCNNAGKAYLASVWDIDALNWINKYSSMYKIGSGDLTAYPIIEKIAEFGKPIILSTGLSTIDEISQSVKFIQQKNSIYNSKEMLAVLQCTSMYPIPESEVNLKVLKTLKDKFNVSIGFSDHTEDIEALYLASVLGVDVLEFHFTDTKEGKTFRDHKVSLTIKDIDLLVSKICRAEKIIGKEEKKPTKSELENKHHITFRRAIYPNRLIQKGEKLSKDDLIALRPNYGIDARFAEQIIGKRAKVKIEPLSQLNFDMFE